MHVLHPLVSKRARVKEDVCSAFSRTSADATEQVSGHSEEVECEPEGQQDDVQRIDEPDVGKKLM